LGLRGCAPLNWGIGRHMKAALRAIGIALGMLGLVIIVLHLFGIALGSETASLVAGGGRGAWIGNMTSDDIEVRARLMGLSESWWVHRAGSGPAAWISRALLPVTVATSPWTTIRSATARR
jgi:hypothetical protein